MTVEPGLYITGKFGVRTESLAVIGKDCGTESSFFGWDEEEEEESKESKDSSVEFYGLESMTLVPYQRSLIQASMLTEIEKKWLNNFNARCKAALLPFLTEEEAAWIEEETKPF